MKSYSIHDAKTNLSKYIQAVKNGEKVYIGNHAKPEVELVIAKPAKKANRKLGVLKDKIPKKDLLALLTYDDHEDPEWQQMIEDMYNKPLG